MSNRRDLKKIINNSTGLLFADCVFYTVTSNNPKLDKIESILGDINNLQSDLLSRVSISEGKDVKSRTKAYYKKIKEDLKTQVDRIGKLIQELD